MRWESEYQKNPRESETPQRKKDGEIEEMVKLSNFLRDVVKEIRQLSRTVIKNQNTKVEIKRSSETLEDFADQIEAEDYITKLQESRDTLDTVSSQLDSRLLRPPRETRDAGTQTTGTFSDTEELVSLEGVADLNTWKQRAGKRWSQELLKNTEIIIGNPVNAKEEVKVVIVDPKDPRLEKSVQKLYIDRFPELGETTRDFEIIEQETKRRLDNGTTRQKVVNGVYDGTDEDLWHKMIMLREETEGEECVVLHHVTSLPLRMFRKMLAAIFHTKTCKIIIYMTRRQIEPCKTERGAEERKERTTFALAVKDDSKDFKALLQEVKEKVKNTKAQDKIRGIRSTREGDILVVMEKDDQALEEIQKTLQEAGANRQVRKLVERGSREIIHLRGLDALADKKEILEALRGKFGDIDEGKLRVGELKPTYSVAISLRTLR